MNKTLNMLFLEKAAEQLKDHVLLTSRMNRYEAADMELYASELRDIFFNHINTVRIKDGYITRLKGYWVTGMYTHNKMRVYDIVEYIPIKN